MQKTSITKGIALLALIPVAALASQPRFLTELAGKGQADVPDPMAASSAPAPACTDPIDHAMTIAKEGLPTLVNAVKGDFIQAPEADFSFTGGRLRPATGSVKTAAPSRTSQKATALKSGYYITKDYLTTNPNSFSSKAIQMVERNDSILMLNVYTGGTKIYLEDEGAYYSIPAQVIFTHASYGDIWLVPINTTQGTYDPKGKVTAAVDAQGNLKLSSWAIMIISGQYEGNAFGAYARSEWKVSNASVKITDIGNNVYSYPMLIEQTYSNRLALYNMVGYGGSIEASITPAKGLSITPQFMLNNPMMGDFFCYAADWNTNKVNAAATISGSATATGFELGDWAIGLRANPAQTILQAKETIITSSLSVNYPTPIGGNFTGEGTESSPYQIANLDDLRRMAEFSASGESFQGKHFTLTKDIDMGTPSAAWDPIGSVSTPFNGKFTATGHEIKNFTGNGRGNNYFALFGYLGPQAVIENLRLTGVSLSGTGDAVAAIAAWNEGSISNSSVNGTVAGGGNETAAIAAVNSGTVKGCSVSGKVAGVGNCGSISGQNYGTISMCSSDADVQSTGFISSLYHCVGGLVGMVSPLKGTNAVIEDSYFCGTLTDNYGMASMGGISGGSVGAHIERCFNVGLISAKRASMESDTSTGGLVGLLSGTEMSDCFNAGTILKAQTSDQVGGLIGYLSCSYLGNTVNDKNTVTNCYNTGYINSTSSETHKGIYGATFELNGYNPAPQMLFNCTFDSQVTGINSPDYGRTSDTFTAGQLPQGFSADVWTATSGRYPMLKKLVDTDASRLAVAFMQLSDKETARKVKKTITLNSDSPVAWGLLGENGIISSTTALSVSGNTITVGSDYGTETVVAYTPDGKSMKAYYVQAVPKVFDGEGTEASPYLIKNKNDFKTLHRAVATFAQPHSGDFFKMTADIDFGHASDFSGVGVSTTNPFGGIFDGDGHTISKLTVRTVVYEPGGKATTKGSYNYAGLFAVLGPTATVKNVTIAADCVFDVWGVAGPIAGYTQGRIENCRNYAPVNAIYQYAGGITGAQTAESVIEGCYNSGAIRVGYEYVGGITGLCQGEIRLCQNDGDVAATHLNDIVTNTNKSAAGGIAGSAYGKIENCVNNATISATRYVGGLIGVGSRPTIKSCLNNGIVACTGEADTRGAIAGNLSGRGEMSGNFFDISVTPFGAANSLGIAGNTGVSTSRLVNGQALEGFDTQIYDFADGKYPVLKRFATETAAGRLRTMFVRFADGEVRTNVVNAVPLSAPQGIVWKLDKNANFTISGSTLNVVQPTELEVASDVLTATLGGLTKVFELKSIPNVLDGRGTESNPFLIRTTDDFNKLSNFITTSAMDYNGFFFRLENNLDFTGKEFYPIALGKLKFQGDFNGNGKTIKGFKYENTEATDGKGRYVGFFGTLGEASHVHDLTLDGQIIANSNAGGFAGRLYGRISDCVHLGTVSVSGASTVAGFASNAYEGAALTNCVNRGTVLANKRNEAGGIVGRAVNTSITGCSNEGTVTAQTLAAGIAVTISGDVTDCFNKGRIESTATSYSYTAGLIGTGSKGELTITRCHNDADITIPGSYLAGIISNTEKYTTNQGEPIDGCFVTMTDCYNTGKLSAKGYAAGVAYTLEGGVNISGCYNKGEISVLTGGYAGGVFGTLSADPRRENLVYNCWNEGNITSTGRQNGGFAQGITEGVNVDNCWNLGNVTTTYVGEGGNQAFTAGFVAYCNGKYTRCWNAGNVTSSQFAVSGFASYGSATIENCFNLGDVTYTGTVKPNANFGGAAGLWNQGQNTSISCYNLGTIKATLQAAGLHSAAWNGAKLINCYNAGDVIVTGNDKTKSDVLVSRRPNVLDGETVITGNYYATDRISDSSLANSQKAIGVTLRELRKAELGEGFHYDRAALPTVADLLKPARQSFAAGAYDFKTASDTDDNVTDWIYFPALGGLTVTADNGAIVSSDNIVWPINLGKLTVAVTADETDLRKEYEFSVSHISSVDEIDAGREVASRKYYDLAGRALPEALRGQVTVVVTRYTDGTVETRRVLLTD